MALQYKPRPFKTIDDIRNFAYDESPECISELDRKLSDTASKLLKTLNKSKNAGFVEMDADLISHILETLSKISILAHDAMHALRLLLILMESRNEQKEDGLLSYLKNHKEELFELLEEEK